MPKRKSVSPRNIRIQATAKPFLQTGEPTKERYFSELEDFAECVIDHAGTRNSLIAALDERVCSLIHGFRFDRREVAADVETMEALAFSARPGAHYLSLAAFDALGHTSRLPTPRQTSSDDAQQQRIWQAAAQRGDLLEIMNAPDSGHQKVDLEVVENSVGEPAVNVRLLPVMDGEIRLRRTVANTP